MRWIENPKNLLSNFYSALSSELLNAIYPIKCGLCSDWSKTGICGVCKQDFHFVIRKAHSLADSVEILFHYEGRAGQAVRRLKYNRSTCLAEPMAILLNEKFIETYLENVDLIVPIPIHWTRRNERGFNQSELLVSKMPDELLAPHMLRRIKRTRPQASLNPETRATNLSGAFAARPDVAGKRVLLVDDVITSGATVDECVRMLKKQGASKVHALSFAGIP